MISQTQPRAIGSARKLMTTKELATFTGLSASFFEKGRIYGHGPKFIRLRSGTKSAGIRYRPEDVERWLEAQECDPEGGINE